MRLAWLVWMTRANRQPGRAELETGGEEVEGVPEAVDRSRWALLVPHLPLSVRWEQHCVRQLMGWQRWSFLNTVCLQTSSELKCGTFNGISQKASLLPCWLSLIAVSGASSYDGLGSMRCRVQP
jgi:hypothetical protein